MWAKGCFKENWYYFIAYPCLSVMFARKQGVSTAFFVRSTAQKILHFFISYRVVRKIRCRFCNKYLLFFCSIVTFVLTNHSLCRHKSKEYYRKEQLLSENEVGKLLFEGKPQLQLSAYADALRGDRQRRRSRALPSA